MDAVEFQAIVRDGAIEIPQEYLENLTKQVRVILLPVEPSGSGEDFIDQLLAHPVKVKGFRPLSRDETHAR